MDNFPRLMKFNQAMKYFNIGSYNTLYKYIEQGLPVTTLGEKRFIDRKEADKFISLRTKKITS